MPFVTFIMYLYDLINKKCVITVQLMLCLSSMYKVYWLLFLNANVLLLSVFLNKKINLVFESRIIMGHLETMTHLFY